MKKWKLILGLLVLFIFFLVWNNFLTPLSNDEIWNYGFSRAIYNGAIPYKDFNMILTPLYPFCMSLLFHAFGSNEIVFQIINSLILVGGFYLLYRLFEKKSFVVLFFLCFPISIISPSYNTFLFVLFILLLFLEKCEESDYLIGMILAFLCLTKQTVGVMVLLVGILFYLKKKDKLVKRLIGFLVPCLIFLIYLIWTKSIFEFFDLCLFGLFDFTNENGKLFNFNTIILIVLVGITIWFIKKNPKKIENYYILAFYTIALPLFDVFHTQYAFVAFVIFLLSNGVKFKKVPIKVDLFFIGSLLGVFVVTLFRTKLYMFPNDIKYFEYRNLKKYNYLFTKEVNEFMIKNNDKEIIFLNSDGYYFKLINDIPLTYLDLINKGNWGYDGSNKLLKAIKKHDDAIFLVNEEELDESAQTDKNVLKYVIENGEKIGNIKKYDIYIFKE